MFEDGYRALVIGSSGAIGSAFVEAFRRDARCAGVAEVSRAQGTGFDLQDEGSIARHAQAAREGGPYRIVVDATGALVLDGAGPEKSLAALDEQRLLRALHVNAVGPALVLRHFAPLLCEGASVYAKLSARVGSIADNRKGGWYGYRASKAALNMLLQTAAIELQRRQPQLRVVALQPGTVRSALSAPFTAGVAGVLEPAASVAGMLAAIERLDERAGAHFVDHHGQQVPW
jgi:NAD(P)-dependent dehydrogenase (short-subunit alcohol dehydrogenase family)